MNRLYRVFFLFFVSTQAFSQTGNQLLTAWTGTIDTVKQAVTGLPANGKVIQLASAITVSPGAAFSIINKTGTVVQSQASISAGMSIVVSDTAGNKKTYAIQPGKRKMPMVIVSNTASSVGSISNTVLTISGKCVYHITDAVNPLQGSFINLVSEDVWLYFDKIKPSVFAHNYLAHIAINGQPPVIDSTVRLVQYLQGCVLISQPSTYQPLKVFTADNLAGASRLFGLYTYHQSPQLGLFDNAIASFVLKKGYMTTFAQDEKGTGASKVYIAADSDLVINHLPGALQHSISFVRVFPWRWVAKKGWTNGYQLADTLHASWNYNWNNSGSSTLDEEYVPIKQNQHWPNAAITNAKKNVTHLLGFNEPNGKDQANMTPDQAIATWPELLQSGLRLGSPAPTDGGASWLYSFMDKADSAGYRVDFVAVHFYRGGQTAQQFYDFLKAIHDRTGRPIWITEWNNGANWTCCRPTYESDSSAIKSFVDMLDSTSFVERYSLYEWVEPTRQLFYSTKPMVLNPAGKVYRDQVSPMAYRGELYKQE